MQLNQLQIDSTTIEQIKYYVFQDLQNLFGLSIDIQAMFDWFKDDTDYDELKQIGMNRLIAQVNLSNTLQNSIFEDYNDNQQLLECLNDVKQQAKHMAEDFIKQSITNQFIQEQIRLYIKNNLSKIPTIKQQDLLPMKDTIAINQDILQQLVNSIDEITIQLDSNKINKNENKYSVQELIQFCKQRYQNAHTKLQQIYPKKQNTQYQTQISIIVGKKQKQYQQDNKEEEKTTQNLVQTENQNKKSNDKNQNIKQFESDLTKQNQLKDQGLGTHQNIKSDYNSQSQETIDQQDSNMSGNKKENNQKLQGKDNPIKNDQNIEQEISANEQQNLYNQKQIDKKQQLQNQQEIIQEFPNQEHIQQNSDSNNKQVKNEENLLQTEKQQQQQQQQQNLLVAQNINIYQLVVLIDGYINNSNKWESIIDFVKKKKQRLYTKSDNNDQELQISLQEIQDFKKQINEQQLQQLFQNIQYYLSNENTVSDKIIKLQLPYNYQSKDEKLFRSLQNKYEF